MNAKEFHSCQMTKNQMEPARETRGTSRWRYLIDIVVLVAVTFLLDAVLSAFIPVPINLERGFVFDAIGKMLLVGVGCGLVLLRGETLAGLAVVLAIFVSACVALYETILRFIHPHALTHLWVLAAAGVIGFAGNELAAQIRLRAGRRLGSAAMTADGNHARVDGFVSLGVVGSAIVVGLGANIADPIIGLVIIFVILKITWDSWNTVRAATIDLDYVDGH